MHRLYNPDLYCLANQTVSEAKILQSYNYNNYIFIHVGALIILYVLAKFYKRFENPPRLLDKHLKELPEIVDNTPFLVRKIIRSKSCFGVFTTSPAEIDLVANAKKENRMSIDQENPREYNYGGYVPLSFGVIIDNYSVIRKLGYGHFSTVWLCQHINTKSYVAIKIAKGSSTFRTVAKDEINILEYTKTKNPKHEGYKNIIQLIRNFEIQSINGRHTCLAFEVMGPSLLYLIEQSNLLGIEISGVRNIINQILLGLTYLHDECNIIHTDIKPENILIKVNEAYIQNLVDVTKQYVQKDIRMPKSYVSTVSWYDPDNEDVNTEESEDDVVELNRNESFPSDVSMKKLIASGKLQESNEIKEPIWISKTIVVQIADLGNACFSNHHCSDVIQTKQYRAPEVIMRAGYGYPADVWSVGCLAFEIATGEYLFNPKRKQNCSEAEEHLAMIWEAVGNIPYHITQKGEECMYYFDKHGKFRNIRNKDLIIWKIKDVLIDKYDWKSTRAVPFADFIEKMLNPDPEQRITAKKALETSWIQNK